MTSLQTAFGALGAATTATVFAISAAILISSVPEKVVVTPETSIINGVKFRTGLRPGKVVWTKKRVGMAGDTHYAKGVVVDVVYEVKDGYELTKEVTALVDFGYMIVKMEPEELVSKEPFDD